MERQRIDVWNFAGKPLAIWEKGWFLLTAGSFAEKKYNSMTVSWGSMGVMWGRPIVICVVRPQRYTREFLDASEDFTLCAFGPEHRKVLDVLGTKSGRDIDKINNPGVTPVAAEVVKSPIYTEATLAIECRKVYYDDLKPGHFLADYIAPMYKKDYHRVYWGEIVAIAGTDEYRT